MNTLVEIEDFYEFPIVKRYGGLMEEHEGFRVLFELGREKYVSFLQEFAGLIPLLNTISFEKQNETDPYWNNGFLPFLDVLALLGFVKKSKPKLYIEIGSGNSTKVVNFAKRHLGLDTKVISIDPCPRAEIDELCDEGIRKPLQDCQLDMLDALEEGDIVFFDGSHRVLQNSDNQVFFFEVLPRLKPGVLVHIHDINWPHDYPDEWAKRFYNEQYVLGAMLLNAPENFDILFPCAFISRSVPYQDLYKSLWSREGFSGMEAFGCSFWMTKKERRLIPLLRSKFARWTSVNRRKS